MNKILRYVMSLLSVMVMSLPLQAQVVIDNTEQETKEEEPALASRCAGGLGQSAEKQDV